jgi:hypothetical protein
MHERHRDSDSRYNLITFVENALQVADKHFVIRRMINPVAEGLDKVCECYLANFKVDCPGFRIFLLLHYISVVAIVLGKLAHEKIFDQ